MQHNTRKEVISYLTYCFCVLMVYLLTDSFVKNPSEWEEGAVASQSRMACICWFAITNSCNGVACLVHNNSQRCDQNKQQPWESDSPSSASRPRPKPSSSPQIIGGLKLPGRQCLLSSSLLGEASKRAAAGGGIAIEAGLWTLVHLKFLNTLLLLTSIPSPLDSLTIRRPL